MYGVIMQSLYYNWTRPLTLRLVRRRTEACGDIKESHNLHTRYRCNIPQLDTPPASRVNFTTSNRVAHVIIAANQRPLRNHVTTSR